MEAGRSPVRLRYSPLGPYSNKVWLFLSLWSWGICSAGLSVPCKREGHRFDPIFLHKPLSNRCGSVMFSVYIIFSSALDQYYIGSTSDLSDRLYRHNHHGSKATKKASDWILVYREDYPTRSEAVRREMQIKGKKSRRYIESLLGN